MTFNHTEINHEPKWTKEKKAPGPNGPRSPKITLILGVVIWTPQMSEIEQKIASDPLSNHHQHHWVMIKNDRFLQLWIFKQCGTGSKKFSIVLHNEIQSSQREVAALCDWVELVIKKLDLEFWSRLKFAYQWRNKTCNSYAAFSMVYLHFVLLT